MALGAAHDDPVRPFFNHAEVDILVRLLLGAEVSVPFDIGDPCVGHKIVLLHVLQKIEEPFIVVRTVLPVDVVCRDGKGRHAVLACTTLETGADAPAQQAIHFDTGHQVCDRSGRVVETVDRLVDQLAVCHDQVAMLGGLGQFIGGPGGLDAGPKARVVDDILHLLPKHVNRRLQFPERLDILRFRHQSHLSSPFQNRCPSKQNFPNVAGGGSG